MASILALWCKFCWRTREFTVWNLR